MARPKRAPLLPTEDAREGALFFVVAALCFLAALTGLGTRAAYGAAENWAGQVRGEMTVRVIDGNEDAARALLPELGSLAGVNAVRLVSREESAELLRPWFGTMTPENLPLPVLLSVETDPARNGVADSITGVFTSAGLAARVEAHDVWADDLRKTVGLFRTGGLIALALLAAIVISVIAFATHAALLARRDVVDVLHMSGASDRFISRLFERRFFGLGLKAGIAGALLALGAAALLLVAAGQKADRSWLLPQMSLDIEALIILAVTPLAAALAAMLAARLTVFRELSGTL